MKHFRVLFPILILALVLSACGSTSREPYDYTYNGKTIKVFPEAATIVDGLDVYRYTVKESANGADYEIIYPNGGRYWSNTGKHISTSGWSDGYNDKLYLSGEILVSALEKNQPRQRSGNVGLGLLAIAMGAWHTLSPESVFYLNKGWMFKNAEPSEGYLMMIRVGGVIAIIAGLVLCVI